MAHLRSYRSELELVPSELDRPWQLPGSTPAVPTAELTAELTAAAASLELLARLPEASEVRPEFSTVLPDYTAAARDWADTRAPSEGHRACWDRQED